MVAQDHRSINSGRHPEVFFCDPWRIIANGQVWHGEIKNRVKDGPRSWVATTIVLFLDHDGKPRPFVTISTDFTEENRIRPIRRSSRPRRGSHRER